MKITNQHEKLEYSKGYRIGYGIAMSKARGENPDFLDFRNDNSIRGKGMKAGFRAANALLSSRGISVPKPKDNKAHISYQRYQEERKIKRMSDAELNALLEGL